MITPLRVIAPGLLVLSLLTPATTVARSSEPAARYSIQVVGPTSGDQTLSVFPQVLGLSTSGAVMMNGPDNCWITRSREVSCHSITHRGYTTRGTNLQGDYLLQGPYGLAAMHWDGSSMTFEPAPFPKGYTDLQFQGLFLIANGDIIVTLIPRNKRSGLRPGHYIYVRNSNGTYASPRRLSPPGFKAQYEITSATVVGGHVMIAGSVQGGGQGPFIWEPLCPRARPNTHLESFGGVGFQRDDGRVFEIGYTPKGSPHLFFTAPLQVSLKGIVWPGTRHVWRNLGRIVDPSLTPPDSTSSGQPILLFAEKIWMNMDGPTYIYEGRTINGLLDLIPANSGWTYLSAGARDAQGRIAGVGTYKGNNYAFLMTPTS